MDWTATGRNTLSPGSQRLLSALDAPIEITAFARDQAVLRKSVTALVERYRRHKADIALRFVDPDNDPDEARALGARADGTLLIELNGRREQIHSLSEHALSNALQRLARASDRWIAYLTGHGERDLLGAANHDLGEWGATLETRGLRIQGLNLAESGTVPDNTALLVISAPEADLLPGEMTLIRSYLERGGNLLWLCEPGEQHGLKPLANYLGVTLLPGTVHDPATRQLGIDNPEIIVVTRYAEHPLTSTFNMTTLFPAAVGLETPANGQFESVRLFESSAQSYAATSTSSAAQEPGGTATDSGPFALGLAMSREQADRRQRIVVLGDGDFLSNAYLGNGGNAALGTKIIDWLDGEDALIDIPQPRAPDATLDMTRPVAYAVALVALIGLPVTFLCGGAYVWIRRRRL